MKNLVILVVFISMAFSGQAQIMKITGIVSDSSGPLPGANITVEGTTVGTQTDFDGNYSITASKGDILSFDYIGFKTKQIEITDSNVINILMEEDAQALEEVVVVGYATRTVKHSLASAVSVISSESLESSTRSDFARQLQGKVSGVSITNMSNLSKDQRLALEGLAKRKENSKTLYIVDGKPIPQVNNSIIENIHPHAIEKKHIYNASRARRTFGITGKKGCIVISTKSGNYQVENDESYAKINENKFEQVLVSPLSTFSIDVDKASYSNVRRMINRGQKVSSGAVKK